MKIITNSFTSEIEQRFLRYVQIDTESEEASQAIPSTERQLDLQHILAEELKTIGAQDIFLSDYGTLFATVPATIDRDVPTVAFLAHVDTTQAFNGFGVKPLVHRNYDGAPITLPDDTSQVLSPEAIPALKNKIGHDIVTASGTTLLGADDKAGVAIIMTLADHLIQNPNIPHGPIRVCFTPDEEIGRGVANLKLEDLDATVAYTLDGGDTGEVVYETFSADKALVTVKGVSAHPGAAKDVLVNALHLAAKIVEGLPQDHRTPETTSDREGFIHLYQITGGAAEAQLHFILRDFERDSLAEHGTLLRAVCEQVAATEPRAQISCEITAQYRNMRYWLEEDMRPVDLAMQAAETLGLTPYNKPIRGGTDGSRLTEMGVPTPNLFTGMQNIHGPQEWVSLQDMAQATEMCVQLVQLWSEE